MINVRHANPLPPTPPITPSIPVRAVDIVIHTQKHLYSVNLLTREITLSSHRVEKLLKGAIAIAATRE